VSSSLQRNKQRYFRQAEVRQCVHRKAEMCQRGDLHAEQFMTVEPVRSRCHCSPRPTRRSNEGRHIRNSGLGRSGLARHDGRDLRAQLWTPSPGPSFGSRRGNHIEEYQEAAQIRGPAMLRGFGGSKTGKQGSTRLSWSERQDLNLRPLRPERRSPPRNSNQINGFWVALHTIIAVCSRGFGGQSVVGIACSLKSA